MNSELVAPIVCIAIKQIVAQSHSSLELAQAPSAPSASSGVLQMCHKKHLYWLESQLGWRSGPDQISQAGSWPWASWSRQDCAGGHGLRKGGVLEVGEGRMGGSGLEGVGSVSISCPWPRQPSVGFLDWCQLNSWHRYKISIRQAEVLNRVKQKYLLTPKVISSLLLTCFGYCIGYAARLYWCRLGLCCKPIPNLRANEWVASKEQKVTQA